MSGRYDDIIHMPHHVSPTRRRMSMVDRGAQFSPFAALTGYDAAIRETGRLTDRQAILDVDEEAALDEKLRLLHERQEQSPEITVTYFVPDEWKPGGAYRTVTGRVRKVDPYHKAVVLMDGCIVYFSRISQIRGEVFQQIEGLYFSEESITIE